MQSKLNPYLSFRDNAREAMEFYKTVFGGKLEMQTFKEFHASQDPVEDNKIAAFGAIFGTTQLLQVVSSDGVEHSTCEHSTSKQLTTKFSSRGR